MAAILVVCTGNVCRSPSAEGLLRRALDERGVPITVASAGTSGWEGSPATPESIAATAERGVDISSHRARRLTAAQVEGAQLVVAMAREHRDAVARLEASASPRTFTLKELVRLLGDHAGVSDLSELVTIAHQRQADMPSNPYDEDVEDPLGMPMATYRAMAWELDDLVVRLASVLRPPAQLAAS